MNRTGLESLVILVALWSLSGCATSEQSIQAERALDPEHFARTATIVDSDLEDTALISTKSGFRQREGLLRMVYDDNFLRAIVDKKTGSVTYQLYQSIHYQASDWRFYRRASYETLEGLESVNATFLRPPLAHNFDCLDHTSSICTFNEHVGFSVEREVLDSIASKYRPNARVKWSFTFFPRVGEDFHDAILAAEVVGFLQAFDSFMAKSRDEDENRNQETGQ